MLTKKLYLIRHAKSDWETPFCNDWERGLSARGRKNANSLAKVLAKRNISIDKAYISDSKRTQHTYAILKQKREFVKDAQFESSVYEASAETLWRQIAELPDSANSMLLLGHNPGLEELGNRLLTPGLYHSLFFKFPTSALLLLEAEVDSWQMFLEQRPGLRFFWIPQRD
ncbi:MAG: histidine phosphatase family protein [Spirochaetota bacterium]